MIDITVKRNTIFAGLNAHLPEGCIAVEANQAQPKPPYPFVTVLFNGPFQAGQTHTGKIYIEDNGEADIDYRRTKEEILVLSVTSVGESSTDAMENAMKCAEWFKWIGYDDLKEAGITVAGIEAMTNRDTLIVDDFERRIGFDVRLMVLSDTTRKESWIGQIERTRDGQTEELI